MKSRLWSLAAAAVFVLSAAAGAFAADTDDDPCSGTKPFREVAQDEIHTMAELCMTSVRRHALADKFLYRPLVLGKMRQPIPAARSALG